MPARPVSLIVALFSVLVSLTNQCAAQAPTPPSSCSVVYTVTVSALNGASALSSGPPSLGDFASGVYVSAGDSLDFLSYSTPTSWCTYCGNAAGATNGDTIGNINDMALAFRYGTAASDTNSADWDAVFAYYATPVTPQTSSHVVPSTVSGTAQLWLGAWDDALSDNYGSVTVYITHTPKGCQGSIGGDPVFIGFRGQRFLVDGQPQRVYNLLTLPTLQLNTRFIPLAVGQAMNSTQQRSIYSRQSKLIAALRKAAATDSNKQPLPATATWSHEGLYMGETAVQIAGHRLLVKPGAYVDGFERAELDGVELAVSQEAVVLTDGSSIHRSSPSVLQVHTADVAFSLVNSDHFINVHSATLSVAIRDCEHVDGLLGQTAHAEFKIEHTASFKQHLESDFMLPDDGDELWSNEFDHNLYVPAAGVY